MPGKTVDYSRAKTHGSQSQLCTRTTQPPSQRAAAGTELPLGPSLRHRKLLPSARCLPVQRWAGPRWEEPRACQFSNPMLSLCTPPQPTPNRSLGLGEKRHRRVTWTYKSNKQETTTCAQGTEAPVSTRLREGVASKPRPPQPPSGWGEKLPLNLTHARPTDRSPELRTMEPSTQRKTSRGGDSYWCPLSCQVQLNGPITVRSEGHHCPEAPEVSVVCPASRGRALQV